MFLRFKKSLFKKREAQLWLTQLGEDRSIDNVLLGWLPFVEMHAILLSIIVAAVTCTARAAEPATIQDKTLVAWVALANLEQRGGSVLTIDSKADFGAPFDGIVFGELTAATWMAGSEFWNRTEREQAGWPAETANTNTLVQIAIVYRGNEVTTFRNGKEYSRHTIKAAHPFDADSIVIIGERHFGAGSYFAGAVDDARIYDRALTGGELATLQPNIEGAIKPWAWWTFDDATAKDRTGRFAQTKLTDGAKIENGRLILDGITGSFMAASRAELLSAADAAKPAVPAVTPEELVLNYHLMHPGGDSAPGDPNAAFYLDGVYHLHYILGHSYRGRQSFSFVHVTSPDMLHWTWQPTKLQPSFTGHGMFSGTGFITKEGKPAAIYHGQGSNRNQIAIAKNDQLSAWEKPYPVQVFNADGTEAKMNHWDPDCFLIGDTYYAISGGQNPPLFKSKDLQRWTLIGDFLQNELPDVAIGEDISCGNFFKLGDKWMLLCISHALGCRYYLGDWSAQAEQFIPQKHGRLNWRREDQALFKAVARCDFFAPESVLTADGRRVMWAWCANLGMPDGRINLQTIQSLPRELSLPADGVLRIKPLRELETLRFDPVNLENLQLDGSAVVTEVLPNVVPAGQKIAALEGEAVELRLTIARDQAARRLFGFTLFSDGQGGGLPILFRPENGTLRVGTAEAPFSPSELPAGENVELRIFIDRYLVEVFANDRQAMIAAHADYRGKPDLRAFTVGTPTTIKKLEIWKLRPTNQGFREAQTNRIWEPRIN
jgi:sucrose-6-phosphate hydrolase SacC (GH32 family)